MHISKISKQINENAQSKGFWENGIELHKKLLLIHSEVSEAMEADRIGKHAEVVGFETEKGIDDNWRRDQKFEQHIKHSFEDELADIAIRVFDLAFQLGLDLEYFIAAKHDYNTRRPIKHGKKY